MSSLTLLPTDRCFDDGYQPGDLECLCSRCGHSIGEETVPVMFFSSPSARGGQVLLWRYHPCCLGFTGVCGASWACEHKPAPAGGLEVLRDGHVIYDAYGKDGRPHETRVDIQPDDATYARTERRTPQWTDGELEQRIVDVVHGSHKAMVPIEAVYESLGWPKGWEKQKEHKRRVTNAIARLVRRRLIYKGRTMNSISSLMKYELRTHRGEVRWMIKHLEEFELGHAEYELRWAQERVERLKRKKAALEKELAGLEAPALGGVL